MIDFKILQKIQICMLVPVLVLFSACEKKTTEVLVGDKKFEIPKDVNIVYDEVHRAIKFSIDAENILVMKKVDGPEQRIRSVDVIVSDVNAEVYGHRGVWGQAIIASNSECEEKNTEGKVYFICPFEKNSSKISDFTVHERGKPAHLIVVCPVDSKLPNPVCEAKSLIFSTIGARYLFNVKYSDNVVSIDNAIRHIVYKLLSEEKGSGDELPIDTTSKGRN